MNLQADLQRCECTVLVLSVDGNLAFPSFSLIVECSSLTLVTALIADRIIDKMEWWMRTT